MAAGARRQNQQRKKKETHQTRRIGMKKFTRCIWDHALYLPPMRNHSWLLILPLMGCSLPSPSGHPPRAEFLVADGGSTFWVMSGPQGIHARVSPLILTRAGGRYYEVFVGETTKRALQSRSGTVSVVGVPGWTRCTVWPTRTLWAARNRLASPSTATRRSRTSLSIL